MQRYASRFLLSLASAGLLAACGEEPADVPEQIRPIRTFTVTEVASGQMRRFSGVVEASDSSSLSFQVGGTVLEVLVNQGDQVTQGQVLAELDREPYELNVKAAEADLERMLADVSRRAGGRARAGLYFSCIARGTNLFGSESEELKQVRNALGDIPLVGFFANGEISNDRLYGYTGVLALFL